MGTHRFTSDQSGGSAEGPLLLSPLWPGAGTHLFQFSEQNADQHRALSRIPLHLLVQGPPPHAWAGRKGAALRGDASERDPASQSPRPCLCAATGLTWAGHWLQVHVGGLLPRGESSPAAPGGQRMPSADGGGGGGTQREGRVHVAEGASSFTAQASTTVLEVTWAWRARGFMGRGVGAGG